MSTFAAIVEKQNNLFGLVSRAFENANKLEKAKLNHHNLDARLKSLDSNWNRFQENRDKLLNVLSDETRKFPYFDLDLYTKCEEAYFDSRSSILVLRDSVTDQPNESSGSTANSSMCRALPKIDLPKFSGEYHEWPSFRDLFKSMVSFNKDIPAVAKLHYLKSQVTDEAARYIANIPVTGDNFARAWEALTNRYENKRVITYLDRLFNVKPITQRSSSQLKSLLSTVKEVIGALESLGLPTNQWDVLIVYFITRRFDAKLLESWELEQGTSQELATFAQLELFLDGRIRTLESVQSRSVSTSASSPKTGNKSKTSARAHAAVLNPTSCSCRGAPHYIASCSNFVSKTINERQDFVT